MKKLLSVVLAILMCASVFSMTSCLDQGSSSNGYTKTEVDGFVNTLKAEVTAKNDVALTEISSLKAVCEAKIAILEKSSDEVKAELKALTTAYNAKVKELEDADKANADALAAHKTVYEAELAKLQKADTDNKAAIDALTTAYNAKVKELEDADKANADALAAHKTAYEAELAKLQKADTDNKAAIDALTTAYNAKVTELNNKITENTNALNAHKTAYEAKVTELNGKISANETAISNLETELEAKINQVKADTEREIGEINTLITQLQNADTTNANAIKALTDAYNAKVAELAAKNKANEDALKALEEFYEAEIEKLKESISYLESDLDFYIQPDGTYAVSVGNSIMMDVIEIPSKHKGKAVTAIIGNGFANCENLTSILIPDSVKSIGAGAFENCPKLKTVYVSKNITEIKDNTFSGCSSLETVNIPAKVTAVGAGAFAECASLKTINIPMAVTTIGMNAFVGCKSIERIDITDLDKFNAISFGGKNANPAVYTGTVYLNGELVDIETDGLLSNLDFQGANVGIASRPETRYRREICVETPADPLDMEIYLRNQEVEKCLNVKLNFIEAPEMWGEPATKITNYVTQEYQAGAESDVDIISAYAAYAVNVGMRGYLVNLKGDDTPYLNTEREYWNQSYINEVTCYDQLYYIVGDLSLSVYDKAIVNFVNLDTAKEDGIDASEFYNHVYNGTWTYDTFYNYVNNYTYIDTNNNFEVDIADDIRISTIFAAEAVDGYYFAFNMDTLDTNADGSHTVNVEENTKLVSGAEKIADLYSLAGIFHGTVETAFKAFIQGKSFFHTDILYRNENQNKELRNASINYSILPLPKYDENQETYNTSPVDSYSTLAVLKTHEEKFEMISAFLELMASKSHDDVRPFYIEKMIKMYVSGSDSVNMIDYIIDGIIFKAEWTYSFEVNRFATNLWRSAAGGTTTVAERWAKDRPATIDAIISFDMFYETTAE